MGKQAIRDTLDQIDGPHRRRVQPWPQGDSIAVSLDKEVLRQFDIDEDHLPKLNQWVFEEEGKIVIDLDP